MARKQKQRALHTTPPEGPTASKGNQIQVLEQAERRRCVAALYCEGKTLEDLAEQFGVSRNTIHMDLKEIRKEWLERSVAHYNERKAEELAKIDRLEGEAWEAWHRSCRECEVTRTRTESVRQVPIKPKGKGDKPIRRKPGEHVMVPIRTSTETTIKGQTGDPRFLEQVAWCIETRLKVMGALKPDTTNVQINQINWAEMIHQPPQAETVEALIAEVERQALVQQDPTATILDVEATVESVPAVPAGKRHKP